MKLFAILTLSAIALAPVNADPPIESFANASPKSVESAPPLKITTKSLPDAQVGVMYSVPLTATGGTPPYTWSTPSLPAGLNGLGLSSDGTVKGVPNAAGLIAITAVVKDSTGAIDAAGFPITIDPPALTVTTTSLPSGQVSTPYSQTLSASNGTAPYTWSLSSGTLPLGLTLSAAGQISGTPTSVGSSSFTVQVKDKTNAAATQALSIDIGPPALMVSTTSLPGGQTGVPYSQNLNATGGSPPYSWSVSAGALPAGLILNLTGAIGGTPTAAGHASFTVQVKDRANASATQALSIDITSALTITTTSLPGGQVGVAYSQTLSAAGGTGPYTWSLLSGNTPGLTLSTGGVISGTPTTAGNLTFTVQVKDTANATATQALSINVTAAALVITTKSLPNGQAGVAYSAVLGASGGTGSYAWSLSSGSLPAGLTLSTAGAISGTPMAAGNASFTVQVKDGSNTTATQALSISIGAASLVITTTSLPSGQAGVSYGPATLHASGGSGTYTWSIVTGSLPNGLLLSNGAITGTPSAAGTSNFTVQVSDGVSTATQPLSITIAPAVLKVTTTSLADGQVGVAYSQTLTQTGGLGPYTWSISGALPAGLSLSGSIISGTPSAAGDAGFTVQVKDSLNNVASQALSIHIAAATLKIQTVSLPDGQVGVAYPTQTLQAAGGSGTYSWSIVSGSLPQGLSLSGASISGTPSALGNANFTVQVSDGSSSAKQVLSINIQPAALAVQTATLPSGQVGIPYGPTTLQASGGRGNYVWSVTSGALPTGLSLSGVVISGTPSNAGTAVFTIQVSDGASTATKALSINVAASSLHVTTTSLANGQVGSNYLQSLQADGGTPPYRWGLASGSTLPAGLNLSSSGQITGTPTSAGSSNFFVVVSDQYASANQQLSITIAPPPLVITTSALPQGSVSAPYSASLQASGGTPPYKWSLAGSLPAGLSLADSGQISGTPSAQGSASFTVKVADSASAGMTANLSITIIAGVAIGSCPAASGAVGEQYSSTMPASGGTLPYAWSISSGQLPAGLNLDSTSGQISGAPNTAGNFSFTLKVSDNGGGSNTQNCTLAIAPALAIGTSSLPDGTVGVAYAGTLSVTGGQPPLTWSASGDVPPGLSIGTGGQVSGTPTTAGSFSFTATVSDSGGGSAKVNLSIRISNALTVSACPAANAVTGQSYMGTVAASGGVQPYSWSASGLAPGLQLDAKSGSISGTPVQSGVANLGLTVTDSDSNTASKTCSITVTSPLVVTTMSLNSATKAMPFSQQLTANGGTPPYSWSVSAGTLPAGVNLSASGTISGTPSASGSFAFTAHVRDNAGLGADQALTLAVANNLSISACPASSGIVGQPYSSQATATGGQSPYTWSFNSGAFPTGLTLNALTGTVSGVPSSSGPFSVTLVVTDRSGATATQGCGFTIIPQISILTSLVPDASQSSPYSQILTASGGQAPYTWSVVSGNLPPGITLRSDGTLTGAATQLGDFSFTVQVIDGTGTAAQKTYTVNVFAGLIVGLCPASLAEIGYAYNSALIAQGGVSPYVFTISGTLPPGLQLNGATVAGTPSQVGPSQITVSVADKANHSASRQCTITVQPPVAITSTALAGGNTGAAYSDSITESGGVPPFVFATTAGGLPPGLALDAATGQISGRPIASGSFSFTVQITDSAGAQATANLTIAVAEGLSLTSCPPPVGSVAQAYSAALVAVGGKSPYVFSISSGALPAGLALNASQAVVSGVPTQAGISTFVLTVNDSANSSVTRACSIQINGAALAVTSGPGLPNGSLGVAYSQTLTASGGQGAFTWSIIGSGTPPGLSLSSAGVLSGTPTAVGMYSFTVQATDDAGNVARQSLTLTILAGPAPSATITGLPSSVTPASQPTFNVQLGGTYPAAITGTVTLTFVPDPAVGVDDPAIQFATGGRTLKFTVPANSSTPVFAAPVVALQTGTVAGTIQLSITLESAGTDITPSDTQVVSIQLSRSAPRIVSMSATQTSTGINVTIVGYSTTREVSVGTFQFFPADGSGPISVTVPLATSGSAWFQSSQSLAYGGQFSLSQPFTFQGTVKSLSSVTATLSNAQGTSPSASANF